MKNQNAKAYDRLQHLYAVLDRRRSEVMRLWTDYLSEQDVCRATKILRRWEKAVDLQRDAHRAYIRAVTIFTSLPQSDENIEADLGVAEKWESLVFVPGDYDFRGFAANC